MKRKHCKDKIHRPVNVAAVLLAALYFFLIRGQVAANEPERPDAITPEMVDSMKVLPGNLGALPSVPIPVENPQTEAKIELGKRLFFDVRLSLDDSTSCATCHDPEKGFADGLPRSKGFNGAILPRNSPTVLNAAYNTAQFWDGRVATLDEQCQRPLMAAAEMNMIDEQHLVERLRSIPGYAEEFQSVYGEGPSLDRVAKAVAAFERTLVTPGSRFDRYALGDKSAINDQEKRGLGLYFGKAGCSECHKGANFTDNNFYSLGVVAAPGTVPDLGRFAVTGKAEDRGAFKTPTLRNVTLTAPYMHDGSIATLEEVIEFYDRGGGDGPNKSNLLYKLELSPAEKADLRSFLNTLTGPMPHLELPKMYPDRSTNSSAGQSR
ncbi:MAG TPA: cytochrome c peroxidase [Candidatus Angelobacter sp.]|nr:cytochrome c peroxidase [Candidatus Angelobacter sp.]